MGLGSRLADTAACSGCWAGWVGLVGMGWVAGCWGVSAHCSWGSNIWPSPGWAGDSGSSSWLDWPAGWMGCWLDGMLGMGRGDGCWGVSAHCCWAHLWPSSGWPLVPTVGSGSSSWLDGSAGWLVCWLGGPAGWSWSLAGPEWFMGFNLWSIGELIGTLTCLTTATFLVVDCIMVCAITGAARSLSGTPGVCCSWPSSGSPVCCSGLPGGWLGSRVDIWSPAHPVGLACSSWLGLPSGWKCWSGGVSLQLVLYQASRSAKVCLSLSLRVSSSSHSSFDSSSWLVAVSPSFICSSSVTLFFISFQVFTKLPSVSLLCFQRSDFIFCSPFFFFSSSSLLEHSNFVSFFSLFL